MSGGALDRLTEAMGKGDAAQGPLYLQLASAMRGLIELGEWRGGLALPPERAMTQATGLSRVTIRKALDTLEEEGLVQRKRGAGNFVAAQIDQPLSILLGFTEDMKRRGADTTSQELRREIAFPTPSEVLKLGLAPGEKVFRLDRVRMAEGEPLAIEHAVVPAAALGAVEVGASLYDALRAAGQAPARALQRLHAGIATPGEARLLVGGDAAPLPVLRIERRSFLDSGRAIEVTTSAYRGDRYDFMAELTLGG
ncbi:GntR family transcriptional regulator [Wenxinia saemankumensis]|uniref:Transcriptional regulator, GntR family n=1 Tax=Wenxinia saemankumensis TaxID=1447782 RepID=A0A1M6A2Q3_9RHOB|nr:GntR family transcriptional regulator [Wenxinia saemankumensis]SHI30736.1 transcriptional regulator, GntR family [Wenxinia saemankumensis]